MTPAEINKELEELEVRVEKLRVKYEMYFQGIEKIQPWVPRKDVDRRMAQLHKEQIRNTGTRFRFQTLVQKYTSLQTLWGRTLRQIEEGTYRRDVLKAQKLLKEQQRAAEQDAPEPVHELSADDAEPLDDEPQPTPPAQAPARPAPTAAQQSPTLVPGLTAPPGTTAPLVTPAPLGAAPAPAPARPASAPVMPAQPVPAPQPVASRTGFSPFGSLRAATPVRGTTPPQGVAPTAPNAVAPKPAEDPSIRQLYNRYVEARRTTGESTDVKFESVARQVQEALPRLREKYQGADVRLDVTVKDGRVVLKPVVTLKK